MLDKEQDRAERFSRRAFVIGAVQGALLCVMGGRLAWLQVAEGGRYKTLAENNRINMKLVAPPRGEIIDRFGVPLALNNQNYRVIVVPEQTENLERALERLADIITLNKRTLDKVIKQSRQSAAFVPLEIKDKLSWEEVAAIEVHLVDLPGISTDVGEIRTYPFAEATAHLIGYVGAASKADIGDQDPDPLLKQPGFKIGKAGLEKTFEPDLRGKAGRAEVEVNVVGREVRELAQQGSTPGNRLALSIDAELQRAAQARLSAVISASAVVMDAQSGAVYALASYPSFNPNYFTDGISFERWEELLADMANPLTYKAVAGQYPPGSTFKMVSALAGLEAGVIGPHTSVFCPGHYDYGNGRFHCWKRGGHGTVNMHRALMQSCDTYFYKMSTDVGIDKISAMGRRLGLGERTGIELSEERPGLIPTQAWKKKSYGESWQPGETIVASIGQGYLLTTPLQLAVMTSRLVNGGKAVNPWIVGVDGGRSLQDGQWPDLGLNPHHLRAVVKGMAAVVNDRQGTAYGARIADEGLEMGGKTGTAQVKRITKQERALGIRNETLEWKYRHHALFVGYAPIEKPRYVCSVVVEHGGGGSAVAAPIARDLLLMAQRRDPAATPIAAPDHVMKEAG